ncbi:hypothetical protein O6H91_08G041000 [Diphasiastrum complanatum]|uniref:Uncharacterized protein n=1 Tax=Diphasiastrum complanatum TaxID=34168 RepID=A0ACC2CWT3_DIPCM|nr:hypothetical protein O6H91_08G041000 [Diphasiastrum complanatum]
MAIQAHLEWGINMLFIIGGNGSHAGADAIDQICRNRKLLIVIVGIPKTIDNDILLIDKTFGFDTAIEEAQRAINAAYVESLLEGTGGFDASGNPILGDFGKWFYTQVKSHFKEIDLQADVKYIDPTYMIRARPCNSSDHIYCSVLGQNAVHGAFAGYTNFTVGLVNNHYCLLPIPEAIKQTQSVDPNSNMWHRCVMSTGQPDFVSSPPETIRSYPLSQRRASSLLQMQYQLPSSPTPTKPATTKAPSTERSSF